MFRATVRTLSAAASARRKAHRFAITYHRSKRSTRMTASALDSVPGLGSIAAKRWSHFRIDRSPQEATVDEITAVPGISVAGRGVHDTRPDSSGPRY